ncbi:MAG: hypothetical protein HZC29_05545 [Thaumarchaeota archaeon]|nr:hypothetical protein [Nitrososphaerota archaeon]
MISDEYVKGILQQVADSYMLLEHIKDKSGDLEIIKRESAKITGLFSALSNKLSANKQEFFDYQHLITPMRAYLTNHDFTREIEMLSALYSEDSMRLKNLRLTILDALSEKNLIGHIQSILRE